MTIRSRRNDLGKRIFFGAFGIAFLFVLWHNERFFLNPLAPEWLHLNPIRWHLIPHGIGGAVALILGASQFSTTLRQHYPRVHRTCGKLYIIGTLILAPVAVSMAFVVSPWFLIVFTTIQSGTLLLFTLAAYACIKRRDIVAHREWMVRSYSILLIFLEGRVLMAIPALSSRGLDSVVAVNWACMVVSLVAVEFFLRWRQLFPLHAPPAVLPGPGSTLGD
jgi:uncharacterized membrane protein